MSKNPYATYRDREQRKSTSKHQFLFMISICSQQMKRHRFHCFISFAQIADIHMSGKRRNSSIGPKWEVNYLYNGQLSTSRCIKTVIIFQQQDVFNVKTDGSVQLFQKIGTIIRSSHDSKWQACLRETDADRSWQSGHGEPWTSRRDEDPTQGNPVWLQPFAVNLEDLRRMCSHIPLREESASEGDAEA